MNISLDTLDPAKFGRITRSGRLDRVLAGIAGAEGAGLTPIKLNTVVVRGAFNSFNATRLCRNSLETSASACSATAPAHAPASAAAPAGETSRAVIRTMRSPTTVILTLLTRSAGRGARDLARWQAFRHLHSHTLIMDQGDEVPALERKPGARQGHQSRGFVGRTEDKDTQEDGGGKRGRGDGDDNAAVKYQFACCGCSVILSSPLPGEASRGKSRFSGRGPSWGQCKIGRR